MNDDDTRIRTAIAELLDAAPPPPMLPHVEPAPRRPRRRPALIALAISVAVVLVTGAIVVAKQSDDDARVVTAVQTPAAVVRCGTSVGSSTEAGKDRTVVLGRVGVTTRQTLQVSRSGETDPSAALFAKDGLLVKENLPVQLIVPRAWRNRLSIEWGNSGLTDHLRVERCPGSEGRGAFNSEEPGPHLPWNAWAGGYFVPKASCVPLIVKAGGVTRRVRIGVGTRCPDPPR